MITDYDNRITLLKVMLELGLRHCVESSVKQGADIFLGRIREEFLPVAELIVKLDKARKIENPQEIDFYFIIQWLMQKEKND